MEISQNSWYASFLLPMLKVKVEECVAAGKNPDYREYSEENLRKINYHISELSEISGIKPGKWITRVDYSISMKLSGDDVKSYFDSLENCIQNE